ncbi:GNAT family N-acetyltransferase [Sediminibacterium roseum]|uniref:GNAT family N-acetyltransferase n=1 Tax=Sediminibacterium roseum TaxID=1978412 RepID=A0ABW9ZXS0_9BACT|nr:GNAT family N-acetyltransferase [Sediminibacterium roseum]NCI51112.1 GNAT family N-acetyltransferase [Sediminibacterium roseum]
MKDQFDPSAEYVLEDDCVLLRPLTEEDCNNLLLFSLNEPEIWKFSLVRVAGEENLRNYIRTALQGRKDAKEYPFIVFDKRTQEFAGSTRFYDIQLSQKTLQLGYTWYGKKFQGTGLNKHCKYLLLQFAFEQGGFERVEFRADNNNQRSIAAMKSIGCTVEGVLRSNTIKADGGRRDSIVLSILKDEWEGGVKERLYARL